MTSQPRRDRIWMLVGQQAAGSPISIAHVCAAAVAGLGVDGAGVTVMTSTTIRDTVYATDGIAAELEESQLTLGEGPCMDSFTAGGPALAADLLAPEYLARWPAFTPAAIKSGARAVFALPLQIGAIRLGVMDLYRRRGGTLNATRLADALAFGEVVGMLLLGGAAGTAELAWQRDDPSANQAVVHQATGMITVQLRMNAETAFARLRAYAYAHERPLGEVARDVVERRLHFDPDPDPPDPEPPDPEPPDPEPPDPEPPDPEPPDPGPPDPDPPDPDPPDPDPPDSGLAIGEQP